jgi:hypothetical protein
MKVQIKILFPIFPYCDFLHAIDEALFFMCVDNAVLLQFEFALLRHRNFAMFAFNGLQEALWKRSKYVLETKPELERPYSQNRIIQVNFEFFRSAGGRRKASQFGKHKQVVARSFFIAFTGPLCAHASCLEF